MTRPIGRWSLAGLLVLALPSVAAAQTMVGHRGYVAVNAGRLALPGEFTDAAIFAGPAPVYTEMVSGAATGDPSGFDGVYRLESGAVFDVGGGARLWGNLGVGVSVSLYTGMPTPASRRPCRIRSSSAPRARSTAACRSLTRNGRSICTPS